MSGGCANTIQVGLPSLPLLFLKSILRVSGAGAGLTGGWRPVFLYLSSKASRHKAVPVDTSLKLDMTTVILLPKKLPLHKGLSPQAPSREPAGGLPKQQHRSAICPPAVNTQSSMQV